MLGLPLFCLPDAAVQERVRKGPRFSPASAPFQRVLGSVCPQTQGERSLEPCPQPAQVASSRVRLAKQLFESMSDTAGFLPLRGKTPGAKG